MWRHNLSEIPSQTKRFIIAMAAIAFFVGSLSGAVFGVAGATLILGKDALRARLGGAATNAQTTVVLNDAVANVVRQTAPAVVSIVVTKDVPTFRNAPLGNDFFGNFFGIQQPTGETERREVGGGTGFLVSADGLIVTNKHVVADESADYSVFTNDGKQYEATVLARDTVSDLALVKIEGQGFPTLSLGDSSAVELGQSVIAIGNALGEFRNTVSTGVVSGLARSITAGGSTTGAEQLSGVIQTDAAINPGNSGGPLLNTTGQVIGINTAVATGAQNIGFAIPINEVKQAIASVQQSGRIVRPFLGVRYVIITPEMAKQEQLSVEYGALLVRGDTQAETAVTPGGPADKAGLKENDIILEINGQRITPENPLAKIVANFKVGDAIKLKVQSHGQAKTVNVTLTERK